MTDSAERAAFVRPIIAARTGVYFAELSIRTTFNGRGAGTRPRGGLSGVISGIGIGIEIFVVGIWTRTIGRTRPWESKLHEPFSMFVSKSMLILSPFCGTPTLISGPQ